MGCHSHTSGKETEEWFFSPCRKMSFEVRLALAPQAKGKPHSRQQNGFPDLVLIHELHSRAWLQNTNQLICQPLCPPENACKTCPLHCPALSFMCSPLTGGMMGTNWAVWFSLPLFHCHVQLMSLSCRNAGDVVLLVTACWAVDGFSSSGITAAAAWMWMLDCQELAGIAQVSFDPSSQWLCCPAVAPPRLILYVKGQLGFFEIM